jgi:putative ABC transport system permease protein
MLRNYYGPQGFDIDHVYRINMEKKASENESEELDNYALAMTFMERVKRYPDIENVALARAAVPYGGNTWINGYKINSDSVVISLRERFVSTEFFDVMKIKVDGQIFDWTDNTVKDDVIISAVSGDKFGRSNSDMTLVPISEVHTLRYDHEWDARKSIHKVIGRTVEIKDPYFQPGSSSIIIPLKREDVNLETRENQIIVRVKPEADKDFVERFSRDMREQLFIGPYYLSSIVSVKDQKAQDDSHWGAKDQINSAYAITLFLVVNIFLGILGSFWFRTQNRRSELGLRIALGSSKKKVRRMIVFETILLLVMASIIGTIICLNLGEETLQSLGVPTMSKKAWRIGKEQNFINFAITFAFLAVVSIIAVWYPAKQASDIQPAEALHDE